MSKFRFKTFAMLPYQIEDTIVPHVRGGSMGGGGVLGVRTPPPPPFGGPQNFKKRGKRCARERKCSAF